MALPSQIVVQAFDKGHTCRCPAQQRVLHLERLTCTTLTRSETPQNIPDCRARCVAGKHVGHCGWPRYRGSQSEPTLEVLGCLEPSSTSAGKRWQKSQLEENQVSYLTAGMGRSTCFFGGEGLRQVVGLIQIEKALTYLPSGIWEKNVGNQDS